MTMGTRSIAMPLVSGGACEMVPGCAAVDGAEPERALSETDAPPPQAARVRASRKEIRFIWILLVGSHRHWTGAGWDSSRPGAWGKQQRGGRIYASARRGAASRHGSASSMSRSLPGGPRDCGLSYPWPGDLGQRETGRVLLRGALARGCKPTRRLGEHHRAVRILAASGGSAVSLCS